MRNKRGSHEITGYGGSRGNFDNSDGYGGNRGENSSNWAFGRSWDRDDDAYESAVGNSGGRGQYGSTWNSGSQQESHRGKGPKGYQRSDERIREDINDELSDDHLIDASDIEVNVEKGEVMLTGSVSDQHVRRMAEEIVESVSGVKNIDNRLLVNGSSTREDNSRSDRSTTSRDDQRKGRESVS